MSAHAVASQTSGTVPLLPRDTAPSRPDNHRLPEPTTLIFRREGGAAIEDTVSPPREGRATDASRLSFPLPLTISAVVFAVSIAAGVWKIASDVRDIGTRFEGQAEAMRIQRDLDKERLERSAEKAQANIDSLKSTVDTIQKEQRLMQIEFQNFRESVLNIRGRQ
jgi:hypothetical protein